MNEELSVHDMLVTMNDAGKLVVHGSGKPDGATVTVTVSLAGGGNATASGTVVSGAFQIEVNLLGPGTGQVEAEIEHEDFPGKKGKGYLDFDVR